MRVLVIPADPSRCGMRVAWPALALAAEGADVRVSGHDGVEALQTTAMWRGDELVSLQIDEVDADVVVTQRVMSRKDVAAIVKLQERGVAVVVDIDDNFQSLNPRNVIWHAVHPADPELSSRWISEACRVADLVTVATPALARRYGGVVIPNHVPASYLDVVAEPHDGVWVGWTGTLRSHPQDLAVTRGGVARAVKSTGAEFTVVGPVEEAQAVANQMWLPQVRCLGTFPLDEYPAAMAQIDVGIVPLHDSQFNEAKSYLKGLEFAALGVPFVASPTGPYRQLAEHCGRLARKPRDWERAVAHLAVSADLRAHLAGIGRDWAAGQTIEANTDAWWDAWTVQVARCG